MREKERGMMPTGWKGSVLAIALAALSVGGCSVCGSGDKKGPARSWAPAAVATAAADAGVKKEYPGPPTKGTPSDPRQEVLPTFGTKEEAAFLPKVPARTAGAATPAEAAARIVRALGARKLPDFTDALVSSSDIEKSFEKGAKKRALRQVARCLWDFSLTARDEEKPIVVGGFTPGPEVDAKEAAGTRVAAKMLREARQSLTVGGRGTEVKFSLLQLGGAWKVLAYE